MRPIYERYRQVKRLLGAAGQSVNDLQFVRDVPSIDALRGSAHTAFPAPVAPAPRSSATRPDSATTTNKEKRSIPVYNLLFYPSKEMRTPRELVRMFWFAACLGEWPLELATLCVLLRGNRRWRLGTKSGEWGRHEWFREALQVGWLAPRTWSGCCLRSRTAGRRRTFYNARKRRLPRDARRP